MKKFLRKTLSLFLAFTLLCSLGLTAAASDALGEDLTSKDTLLNRETQLSTNVFWSSAYSDLRTENVVTYTPNEDVTPHGHLRRYPDGPHHGHRRGPGAGGPGLPGGGRHQRRLLQHLQRPAHRHPGV